MTNIIFGAVADDDTGATDLAGMLVEQGVRTVMTIDSPSHEDFTRWTQLSDAVVLAIATRANEPRQAYLRTRQAVRLLRELNPRTIELKYCSTFDSTERGNIGPSIDAALEETGETFTVALPALPVNGRTTYMGYHFVHQQLLSDSPMRLHPLNPMTNPNLVSHLQAQTTRKVGLVPHPVVRHGAEAVRAHFGRLKASGVGVAVLDCIDETDLAVLCEAISGLPVITGSSAPAMRLPAVWQQHGWWAPSTEALSFALTSPGAGSLILAGSCSVATRGQNTWFEQRGMTTVLDPLALLAGGTELPSVAARIASGEDCLLRTASEPDDVQRVHSWAQANGRSAAEAGLAISSALAKLCRHILEQASPCGLIVAGGETAGAVCRELRLGALQVGRNIEPGVPLCYSLGQFKLPVVLKSGNFGSPDFYGRSIAAIRRGGA